LLSCQKNSPTSLQATSKRLSRAIRYTRPSQAKHMISYISFMGAIDQCCPSTRGLKTPFGWSTGQYMGGLVGQRLVNILVNWRKSAILVGQRLVNGWSTILVNGWSTAWSTDQYMRVYLDNRRKSAILVGQRLVNRRISAILVGQRLVNGWATVGQQSWSIVGQPPVNI